MQAEVGVRFWVCARALELSKNAMRANGALYRRNKVMNKEHQEGNSKQQ